MRRPQRRTAPAASGRVPGGVPGCGGRPESSARSGRSERDRAPNGGPATLPVRRRPGERARRTKTAASGAARPARSPARRSGADRSDVRGDLAAVGDVGHDQRGVVEDDADGQPRRVDRLDLVVPGDQVAEREELGPVGTADSRSRSDSSSARNPEKSGWAGPGPPTTALGGATGRGSPGPGARRPGTDASTWPQAARARRSASAAGSGPRSSLARGVVQWARTALDGDRHRSSIVRENNHRSSPSPVRRALARSRRGPRDIPRAGRIPTPRGRGGCPRIGTSPGTAPRSG